MNHLLRGLAATMALAAALSTSGQARAQAPAPSAFGVQVYGTIDVGAGKLANQAPGAPTTGVVVTTGVFSGVLQTSYIGFRGTEDLGGGLTARFQLETFVRVDTGQPTRFDASPTSTGDAFWSREAFVGLAGSLGEVRLGNNGNPLWISMLQTNALGSNSTFSPSFRQLYNGSTRGRSVLDTALVNSVSYATPVFAGLSALAVYQLRETRGSGDNHGASVTYRAGPLLLAAALQHARHAPVPNVATTANQDMLLVGAAYNFGPVRLFGQYSTVDNVSNKSRVPHIGLTAPLGAGVLQFSTGQDKNKVVASGVTTKRTTTSLGYVYSLSKRTDLYGFVMTEEYPVVGPAANSGDSAVLGIRHRF